MLITPITVRLIAYGAKANITAIRNRAADLLRDEHGSADARCFTELSAQEVYAEICAERLDQEIALKKPTSSQIGVAIILAAVHERLTTEWLYELPSAKTCVAFATWRSQREALAWQILIAYGDRWAENRPL